MTRLEELEKQSTWTDAEMAEMASLMPAGEMKTMGNLFDIGVKNPAIFFANLLKGAEKSNNAFDQGFYIETISLRLQYMEIFLRMYVVAKNKSGKVIADTDKRTFGNYINECSQLGFDATLIKELKDFNDMRIIAIHKFLIGDSSYEDFEVVCKATKGLDMKIIKYVGGEIGIPVVGA